MFNTISFVYIIYVCVAVCVCVFVYLLFLPRSTAKTTICRTMASSNDAFLAKKVPFWRFRGQ